MKYEAIQALLDRYWEGETTLDEERTIKAYFQSTEVDERLRTVAPLFQALREEQTVQFAAKAKAATIRPQLYQWAAAASVALVLAAGWWMFGGKSDQASPLVADTPALPAQPPVAPPNAIEQTGPKAQVIDALAAHKTPKINQPRKKKPSQKQENAPEIDAETAQAMAEIKAALALVSSKLDKGRSQAVKGATFLDAMEKLPRRKSG